MSEQAHAAPEQLVLHPLTLKSIGMSLGSLVTAVICFQFWVEGLEYAWIAGGFLAVGTVFYAMHLVPSAYALTLDRDGFEIKELYAVKRYAWSEVSEFSLRRGILGAAAEFHHQVAGAPVATRVKFNETFGYAPPKMVEILNEWRGRMTPRPDAPPAAPKANIWRSRKR